MSASEESVSLEQLKLTEVDDPDQNSTRSAERVVPINVEV